MNEPNDYLGLYSRGITLWSITAILALGTPIACVAAATYPQNVSQSPASVTSKVKIQKINIQGNHGLTTSQIKGVMKLIKEGSSSSAPVGTETTNQKLQEDVTRVRLLYYEHGYTQVNIPDPIVEVKKVEVGRTLENQYFITINIEENAQYRIRDVKVTGNKQFTADEVRRTVGLVPGQVYNERKLLEGFVKLKKMYASRGFLNFFPDLDFDFDETKKVISLTINIQES
jgi:outer membrane protein insertion porin family